MAASQTSLAWSEMRRAKLKFGLLTVAVSLLVFLVLFLSTLSSSLVNSFTGAIKGLDADVIAYSDIARDNIQGSRLAPYIVDDVRAVPGVRAAGPVATTTVTGSVAGTESDLALFGFDPGQPGQPTALEAGRLPQDVGEAAVDATGVEVGDTVEIPIKGKEPMVLDVVGTLRGAQFSAAPTAYVTMQTYADYTLGVNPSAPFVPINAVAVDAPDVAALVRALNDSDLPITAYALDDAVAKIPGVESVSQTFGILVGLTFVISVVVVGFFFLILTVQKLKVFTLLRAAGASTGSLARSVSTQIAAVVLGASALAVLLVLGALKGVSTGIPVVLSPGLVIGTVLAVLAASLLAGLLSVRRIVKLDPASAAGAR